MAFLGQTYAVKDIPEQDGFEPIPAGWYNARITEAEVKSTKAGTGSYIKVRYDITGPTHQGRVIYGNINLSNPNQQAEQIGIQQLGSLARAIGLEVISDSDQLINRDVQIKLSIKKDTSGQYNDSNDVKGFKAIDGAIPSMSTVGAAPTGKTATPPWAAGKK